MKSRAVLVFAVGALLATGRIFAGPEAISTDKEAKNVQMEQAAECDVRWYVSLGGGAAFDIGNSNFSHEIDYRIFPFLIVGPTSVRQRSPSLSWDDVYDTTWRGRFELGYALTEHLELFGSFEYSHADASGFNDWGRLNAFNVRLGPAVVPLRAGFDDYDAFGGELGFRFFFFPRAARIRPYFAVSGGALHVNDIGIAINADASLIGGPSDLPVFRGGFYDDSWVGTGAAVLGVEANLTCHWALGVNGGVRYQTRLHDDDGDFNGREFIGIIPLQLRKVSPANEDAGDRWTVPVTGYVKFRF